MEDCWDVRVHDEPVIVVKIKVPEFLKNVFQKQKFVFESESLKFQNSRDEPVIVVRITKKIVLLFIKNSEIQKLNF